MAAAKRDLFLRRLTRSMAAETLSLRSDRQLVEKLLGGRDEAAFEAIVRRHGPMVYRVCWRVLQRDHDAEDVFQATFLLLAQKLGTVRKHGSLASWLHGVAHRLALKARALAAARRRHERSAARGNVPGEDTAFSELRAVLDAELAGLPDKWRLPLILCYLEGRTQDEAAGQLGWSKSTLRRRLDAARTALGQRLERRGFGWQAAWAAVLVADCARSAVLPSRLVTLTVDAAAGVAAGQLLPTEFAFLTEGVSNIMAPGKLQFVSAVLLAVAVGGTLAVRSHPTAAQDSKAEKLPENRAAPDGPTPRTGTVDPRLATALDAALRDSAGLTDPMRRVTAFRFIARVQAGAGRREAAADTLRRALDAERAESGEDAAIHKDNRLWLIAECQAETGDARGALETAGIVSELNRHVAVGTVAAALARAGEIKRALEAIDQIQGEGVTATKDEAYRHIAECQARAGDVRGAAETAERISADTAARAWVLAAVAVGRAKAGDRDGAAKRLVEASTVAEKAENKPVARMAVAEAQAAMGMAGDAEKTAASIEAAGARDQARLRVSAALAARGDVKAARESADKIAGAVARADAQKAIVAALVRANDLAAAAKSAADIGDELGRCYALVEVARARSAAGQKDRAEQTLRDALALADGLEDRPGLTDVRAFALAHVIGARAAIGDVAGALKAVEEQDDPWLRTMARIRVAEALASGPQK